MRLPDGKPMRNVEWPSQVMESGVAMSRIILRGFMSGPVPVQFIRGRRVKDAALTRTPKPDWLKVRAPGSENYLRLKGIMRDLNLHTVCEEAHCPNIGECWHHGTATFMIMGDVCTRACGYCNVKHGAPAMLDPHEADNLAHAVATMELAYVVVTSVDRDDLPDFGAGVFASTIRAIKARRPECRVEVLIPDFQGKEEPLRSVLDARPDVLNHNTETVPRLYRMARPGGRNTRALELLERARRWAPDIPTKTGIMVGLGETFDEVVDVIRDLRKVDCQILTIGQYLRPSLAHLPMDRYCTPDEFRELKRIALELGFGHVESGPLVRSSYHAHEQAENYSDEILSPLERCPRRYFSHPDSLRIVSRDPHEIAGHADCTAARRRAVAGDNAVRRRINRRQQHLCGPHPDAAGAGGDVAASTGHAGGNRCSHAVPGRIDASHGPVALIERPHTALARCQKARNGSDRYRRRHLVRCGIDALDRARI